MIGFDEALHRVVTIASPLGVEKVAFTEASGRILAAPVKARFSMPRGNVSAMDGYAVRDADLRELPFEMNVAGESAAGSPPGQILPAGSAFRIFTGAPVPQGADRVIVQENAEREADTVRFVRAFGPGRNIRKVGSDFLEGDILLSAGEKLDWRAITTAAAADHAEVEVFRQTRVVILATGDELAAPGLAHGIPGAIPESVSFGVAALTHLSGATVVRSERLPDDPVRLEAAAEQALADSDIVIVIGGASVGDRDHARSMFGTELDYVFPKVAIKPGKPVWLARVKGRLVMGLPGNPTSALVTARLFLAPLLAGLGGGDASSAVSFQTGMCADSLPECGGRETFIRARRTEAGFVLAASQDSASQSSLAASDILIRRQANSPAEPQGASVSYLSF